MLSRLCAPYKLGAVCHYILLQVLITVGTKYAINAK